MPLHPQSQAFVDSLAEQNPPSWEELGPVEARKAFTGLDDLFGTGPDITSVSDIVVNGEVPIRLYRDVDDSNQPIVMFFHGGGWVLGSIETHDALCRKLCKQAGAVVVSVDYGLAPDVAFPESLDQCYEATKYVAANAAKLGGNADRLVTAGDSAGGNLAAAVPVIARDSSGPPISLQVLLYPVISPDFDTPTYQEFAEGHGLTRRSMQWFWECYLAGSEELTQPLADLRQHDPAGLPPALVLTAEYDVLRSESEAYADRLESADVPVTRRQYDGMLHGFIHFAAFFDDADKAIAEVADAIRSV